MHPKGKNKLIMEKKYSISNEEKAMASEPQPDCGVALEADTVLVDEDRDYPFGHSLEEVRENIEDMQAHLGDWADTSYWTTAEAAEQYLHERCPWLR